ncbi:MAG: hypothetical protein U9N56_06415 [Actinomycetota bacterium]|nr:hypothetical protein [Actinomycetota bacterium]
MRLPNYDGAGLVNLIAELEVRLTGSSESPGLVANLAAAIPDAETYVLVLFDGLGDLQLTAHPEGGALVRHRAGALDASFSTQTSVATATLATGLPPARHGLISYLLRFTGSEKPVNTLWWFDTDGNPADVNHSSFLPAPNLAERLSGHGVEAVVIEPDAFLGSPLDRVLYRGAPTRGVEDVTSMAPAVLEEAARRGRLVVCYLPYVDAAGHVEGTASEAYSEALRLVTGVWEAIGEGLPSYAAMVGTADHGIVDIERHIEVTPPESVTLYGDSRVVYVSGNADEAERLAADLPATWVTGDDLDGLWGPGPTHADFDRRKPDGLLVADAGVGFLYPGNDLPLAGNHGGLTEEEMRIPLLVYLSAPNDQ